MPIIKTWCLPNYENGKDLKKLHEIIVTTVCSIKELGFSGQNDMTCMFPTDMMKCGLGTDIIVEVSGLLNKPECTYNVRQTLANKLGQAVNDIYPDAKVECLVYGFGGALDVYWSLKQ